MFLYQYMWCNLQCSVPRTNTGHCKILLDLIERVNVSPGCGNPDTARHPETDNVDIVKSSFSVKAASSIVEELVWA